MMCKSGEVSVNPYGFLCTTKLDVTYTAVRLTPASTQRRPQRHGRRCNAFVQLLGIARHGSGMTRINVASSLPAKAAT